MAKLFFVVSGENPTLPFSEVKSILEAEGFPFGVLGELTQVLRIEAKPDCIRSIRSRSAMARICGIEIFNCEADIKEIFKNLEKAGFVLFMGDGESFAVRVKRVRGSSTEIDRPSLERMIGETILRRVKGAKVSLEAPEKSFFGILTEGRFLFGLKVAEIKPGKIIERGTRKKVFFHSAAMPAKLARCMVNLAQPEKGDIVLDPFCGTGSFLVEAGLIGCRVLGFDVERYMVEGSLKNLSLCGVEPEGIAVADARYIPLSKSSFGCVVTDPPYGTSATTLGLDLHDLYQSFFSAISELVGKGRRVCLAAPKTLRVKEIGERTGFKHLESHFIYIHRRLTREIAVFKQM